MFYSDVILSKKGPLAKVWIAAHWEKKLSKAQTLQTNIGSTVDVILQDQTQMTLRLSGQLLLGVARIYSRKARYLLDDCNEAFIKIKLAFRSGASIDLLEEVLPGSLNLPECLTEFDILMPDPPLHFNWETKGTSLTTTGKQASHTATNLADITLRSDMSQSLGVTGGFGTSGLPLQELEAEYHVLDEHEKEERRLWEEELGLEPPPGEGLEASSIEIEQLRKAVEPGDHRKSLSLPLGGENEESETTKDMDKTDADDLDLALPQNMSTLEPILADEGELTGLNEQIQKPFFDEQSLQNGSIAELGQDASLQNPLLFSSPATPSAKATSTRKRKLAQDSKIELSSKVISQQLKDSKDIIKKVNYLPLNRQELMIRQVQDMGLEVLLQHTSLEFIPELSHWFSKKFKGINALKKYHAVGESNGSFPNEDTLEKEVVAESSVLDIEMPRRAADPELSASAVAIRPEILGESESKLEEPPSADMDIPEISFEKYISNMEQDIDHAQQEPAEGSVLEQINLPLMFDTSNARRRLFEQEEENDQNGSQNKDPTPAQSQGKPTEVSHHTTEVIHLLSQECSLGQSCSFESLAHETIREDAAKLFFELLVLKTKGLIEVSQKAPYSNIDITPKDSLFELVSSPNT